MKIVVLDGYPLNPGDLSWEGFKELGDFTLYDETPDDQAIARAQGCEIIITNKTEICRALIDALPMLKYVGEMATGYDNIDVRYARSKGITVTNIPTYGTPSVAQFTFALLLELCHHAQEHNEFVHRGDWSRSRAFSFWNYPQIELAGKTLGIIGFGRIGQKVADIASAFGLKILAYDKMISDQSHRPDFRWVDMPALLAQSDVISLHCPLFPENRGMINKQTLALMKKGAFLINTSRGPLIVDQDLADALRQGQIAGAALDVLSDEPPLPDNPLLTAPNCLITPHIAWATQAARSRLMETGLNNLVQFLQGKPVNVVN
jgi:glycerate dehydrogenase